LDLRTKIKRALFSIAITGLASWSALVPVMASAAFFSLNDLLSSITPQTDASGSAANSQTTGALAAANNTNPSPIAGGELALVADAALVPQIGPSGTAADVASAEPSQISVYTVHDGDTLSGIAELFGVSVGTITGANDLGGKDIQPGEQLIILPITGVQYTVQSGDTLASVAQQFNSNANDIAQYNNLADGASLTIGEQLLIPGGETPAPAASAPDDSHYSSDSTPSSASSGSEPTLSQIAAGATELYLGGGGAPIPGYFAWPLPADAGVVTQGLHGWNAVDIGAPTGTSIYAAAAGSVIVAQDDGGWNGGYGNYVVISHANGTQTLYAHMSKVLATVGESVVQGETIGLVGMTGLATGPHVHFEVRGAQNPFAGLPLGSSDPF
jgi:murein DD-endopeptidase MepM/ murein hydrolase activator NlpD